VQSLLEPAFHNRSFDLASMPQGESLPHQRAPPEQAL